MSFNVKSFTSSLYEDDMSDLQFESRRQAVLNFKAMIADAEGRFQQSIARTLCDVFDVDWYNTDLDKFLTPFQLVRIAEIDKRALKLISKSVLDLTFHKD